MGSRSRDRGQRSPARRELQLWLAALVWVVLIYSTLSVVRAPVEFLRERNLLRGSVAAVFLLTAAAILFVLVRRRARRGEYGVFALFGLVYVLGFASLSRAEERIHLVEYGILAVLLYAALLVRRARTGPSGGGRGAGWVPALVAVGLASLVGWGDEIIQGVLPNRVYDLRDVGINAGSAVLAVSGAATWRRIRERS